MNVKAYELGFHWRGDVVPIKAFEKPTGEVMVGVGSVANSGVIYAPTTFSSKVEGKEKVVYSNDWLVHSDFGNTFMNLGNFYWAPVRNVVEALQECEVDARNGRPKQLMGWLASYVEGRGWESSSGAAGAIENSLSGPSPSIARMGFEEPARRAQRRLEYGRSGIVEAIQNETRKYDFQGNLLCLPALHGGMESEMEHWMHYFPDFRGMFELVYAVEKDRARQQKMQSLLRSGAWQRVLEGWGLTSDIRLLGGDVYDVLPNCLNLSVISLDTCSRFWREDAQNHPQKLLDALSGEGVMSEDAVLLELRSVNGQKQTTKSIRKEFDWFAEQLSARTGRRITFTYAKVSSALPHHGLSGGADGTHCHTACIAPKGEGNGVHFIPTGSDPAPVREEQEEMASPKQEGFLQEGDVIELAEGHKVSAYLPNHLAGSPGDYRIRLHTTKIGGKTSYLAGKYIVTEAGYSAEEDPIWRVRCKRADEAFFPDPEPIFYQEQYPEDHYGYPKYTVIEDIEPVAKAERKWILPE